MFCLVKTWQRQKLRRNKINTPPMISTRIKIFSSSGSGVVVVVVDLLVVDVLLLVVVLVVVCGGVGLGQETMTPGASCS